MLQDQFSQILFMRKYPMLDLKIRKVFKQITFLLILLYLQKRLLKERQKLLEKNRRKAERTGRNRT